MHPVGRSTQVKVPMSLVSRQPPGGSSVRSVWKGGNSWIWSMPPATNCQARPPAHYYKRYGFESHV